MDVEFAYNKIFDFLENEDASINLLNPKAGIFFAPELYLVFQIGKLLKTQEEKIFNGNISWIRETNFGNGGPTDLIFLKENELFLFEFKIASTSHSYMTDVEKLKRLNLEMINSKENFKNISGLHKYFIAIVDVFSDEGKKDGRVVKLAEN